MSDSVQLHRWQPTRLPHPWDSPGKNTGVGCHFLLHRASSRIISIKYFCSKGGNSVDSHCDMAVRFGSYPVATENNWSSYMFGIQNFSSLALWSTRSHIVTYYYVPFLRKEGPTFPTPPMCMLLLLLLLSRLSHVRLCAIL